MPFDVQSLAIRTTRTIRAERDAARAKLAKQRAETIVAHLCALTRLALEAGRVTTPLSYEALFRRVIRSQLCLQGWRWQAADETAQAVVDVVFAILQVKRPTWNEGQPEWTIESGTLIERTRCARCHKPLPDGHYKFCSSVCKVTYHSILSDLRRRDEINAGTAMAAKV